MKREYDILAELCAAKQATPNITVSKGTLVSATVAKVGKVCVLALVVKNSSAAAAGSNMFEGNIQGPRPKVFAAGVGFLGSNGIILQIAESGNIKVRVTGGSVPANTEIYVSATFVAN